MTSRLSWWLVFWGALTSLSLNWVLPAFDHHAAEYNPFHTHQVLGATIAQRDALMAAHTHGAGHPHEHHAATEASLEPAVVSLTAFEGLLTLIANAADLVVSPGLALPSPPLTLWLAAGVAGLVLWRPLTPPPERPPRFAR